MTTASAMLSPLPQTELPNVQLLQDVLYDILAVGVDSDASASTTSAIEAFLHEHARSPKSGEAFVQFFREQGLSWKQARPLEAQPQALPPLKLVRPATPAPIDPARVQAAETGALPAFALDTGRVEGAIQVHAASAARRTTMLWGALALLAVALGVVGGVGYGRLQTLSAQVHAAQGVAATQAERLSVAQQRIERLEADAQANDARMTRAEQQSALMMEALLPATPAR